MNITEIYILLEQPKRCRSREKIIISAVLWIALVYFGAHVLVAAIR